MNQYLYGIFTADAVLAPSAAGIGGAPLEAIRAGALVALVHEGGFAVPGEARAAATAVAEHQRAVIGVRSSAALPAKLGSVLPSREAVLQLLEGSEAVLVAQLERVRDFAQVNLTAFWNLQQEIGLAAIQPEVAEARHAILERGGVTPEDQARIGQLIAAALEAQRGHLLERTLDALGDAIAEHGQAPRGDDATAFHLAILCRNDAYATLEARLAALDEALGGRLDWRVSEPLPPFAFSALEVVLADAAELERARAALGLREPATGAEAARKAFKRLALEHHPDRNANDPNAAATMHELARARDLLEACAGGVGVRIMRAVTA